jgi:myo-inositol-1(or 4)-monophosphatase
MTTWRPDGRSNTKGQIETMADTVSNALLLSVAREAALAAGKEARRMFSEPRRVMSKGPRDVVTDADVASQKIITAIIQDAFPDHGFVTEEDDDSLPAGGPILWLIDPIDGTTNYSRGVPIFCVSIAAVENFPPLSVDDILAGAVYDPMLDELFTASAGAPALLEGPGLHGRPLRTSGVEDLGDAAVGIDWALNSDARQKGVDFCNGLAHRVNVFRSLGSATLAMAWVAAGRLDAYANFQLKPWDVAAAALLVKQAGGIVTDLAGRPLQMGAAGGGCLVCNAHLAPMLLT